MPCWHGGEQELQRLHDWLEAMPKTNQSSLEPMLKASLPAEMQAREEVIDLHKVFDIVFGEDGNIRDFTMRPITPEIRKLLEEDRLWVSHLIASDVNGINAKIIKKMIAKARGVSEESVKDNVIYIDKVPANVDGKKAYLSEVFKRVRALAKAKANGREVSLPDRQILILTTQENFADIYQYVQAIGDFTVGILAADGTIQVSNRTINALAALGVDVAAMGIMLGDLRLVPKSNVSILESVISAKSAEIKA